MSNKRFFVFISFVFAIGFGAGFWAAGLRSLKTSPLLNIAGLSYELLAVVVLSEVATAAARWKEFSVSMIAPAVLWSQSVAPLGSAFAGFILVFVHTFPSATEVWKFALGFWSYSLVPLGVLNETVVFPLFSALKGVDSRWRWFGLYLLATGIVLQLIAATISMGQA